MRREGLPDLQRNISPTHQKTVKKNQRKRDLTRLVRKAAATAAAAKTAQVKTSPRPEADILAELQKVCTSPGYVHVLGHFSFRDNTVLYEEELTEKHMAQFHKPNRLLRTEINTLMGLMIKAPIDWTLQAPAQTQRLFDASERLLEELHEALSAAFSLKPVLEGFERGEQVNPFEAGEVLREPMFYAGESAYNFQYLDFAARRYAGDAAWLQANVGFTIDQACRVAEAIDQKMMDRFNQVKEKLKATHPDEWTMLPAFCVSVAEVAAATALESELVEKILDKFCVPGGANNAGFVELQDFNLATATPLLRTPDGDYLSLQTNGLAEAIYESPFYWMLADKAYQPTQLQHRGAFTEDFLAERLKRVFGAANVLTNINVLQGKKVVAEIDVLVLWADRAIIVQAKSKRLTIEARKGNDQVIRKDFQQSVQDAYDQGLFCGECIGDTRYRFVQADGTEVTIPAISEIFMFCVVSDHYPALSFQTRQFLKKRQVPRVRAALVTDLFLVDVLTELLPTPLHLLSYIGRRAGYDDRIIAAQELTILGYHLKHNLWLDDNTLLQIDEDFGVGVDLAMAVRRRGVPGAATPEGFLTHFKGTALGRVVRDIEDLAEPAVLEQGFQLLEMDGRAIADLNLLIDRQASRAAQDGQGHNGAVMLHDGTGLSVLCSPDGDAKAADDLAYICARRKYAQKADRWFGMCLSPAPARLRFGLRLADPWQQDDGMDELTAGMQQAMPLQKMRQKLQGAVAGPKVGRNDPCPCQSGKKFKKCCGA